MQNIINTLAANTTSKGQKVDCVGGSCEDTLITNVTNILNAIIGVLGIVCVIVMIIGGITYMTSSGDTEKVKKGRNTILYGLIGLVICALAFAIVNFVIVNIIGNN